MDDHANFQQSEMSSKMKSLINILRTEVDGSAAGPDGEVFNVKFSRIDISEAMVACFYKMSKLSFESLVDA